MPATSVDDQATGVFQPIVATSGEELKLSMQRLWLTGRVMPVGARLMVHHVFQSNETKPIEVVYAFALPRDAALRRFRIKGDYFSAHSKLMPTPEAVKTYEAGIAAGSLSTLARQHGDGVINLTLGNVRPGETVTISLEIIAGVESRDNGFRFRFPFSLAPGYHPRVRAVEAEPGVGEMELPEDEFGDVILPRYHKDVSKLHSIGFDLQVEGAAAGIASPSHHIRTGEGGKVGLAIERDVPNRDLVIDGASLEKGPQVFGDQRHFAALIPSSAFGVKSDSPRRVVVLLDRSGSMQGGPIQQARKAIEACLGALSATDEFGLIAFDDKVESCSPTLLPATKDNRQKAREFLVGIDARGGTELLLGVEHAAVILKGAGDVLILTDGQVMGTEQILSKARAAGIRLHCLGIGSASQDRFLTLLARETGGVSRFVTANERVDVPAVDLFASIGRPVASDLRVEGALIQPEPPPAVFAGTPAVLFGEKATGFTLRWNGGSLDLRTEDRTHLSETMRLLQGARRITDLEARYMPQSKDRRQDKRVAERLRSLSEEYGLASREMSLVAVVSREGDRPDEIPQTRIVPVGMPEGTQFDAYFGAPTMAAPRATAAGGIAAKAGEFTRMFSATPVVARAAPQASAPPSPSAGLRSFFSKAKFDAKAAEAPIEDATAADHLLDLASQIEDDGGMPGKNPEDRARKTMEALEEFIADGNTLQSGAFRQHVARLLMYLEGVMDILPSKERLKAESIVRRLAK